MNASLELNESAETSADDSADSGARSGKAVTLTRWISIALIVISLMLVARRLPVEAWIGALEAWIGGLGWWGPAVFALVYVAATVLFVPGSALTLAGGAIFGLLAGTIAVSFGSTTGAALAFLLGRYLLRDRVARMARRYPKFDAIDRAIGLGGWKIVALLRLSPAVPFNLQNYLYGLTSIRFWPCILTSWIAMLPGTFMYVYIGYVGRQGLEAAAGGGSPAGAGRWILLIVGLLATVVVTIYVTRLAMKMLSAQTGIPAGAGNDDDTADSEHDQASPAQAGAGGRWSAGVFATAAAAVVCVCLAVFAYARPADFDQLLRFGPPAVTMAEAYQEKPAGPSFDHSILDGLLRSHVDGDGWVDYAGLNRDAAKLGEYLQALGKGPFDALGRDEKLALLINAYNAFTLRLILDHWDGGKLQSIKDIDEPWDQVRWKIGSNTWSLNDIEHRQIRPKFMEPRIHFALVCAAVGCPKLRNEAYRAERIETQLDDQMRYCHSHDRWFRFDAGSNTAWLTKLYQWYAGDFEQAAGSVLAYVARYAPPVREALDAGHPPEIRWLDYSWLLNDVRNRDGAATVRRRDEGTG